MKRILEFDDEDSEAFTQALRAGDYYAVLFDLDSWLRNEIKYQKLTPGQVKAYTASREKLHELLIERGQARLERMQSARHRRRRAPGIVL